MSISKLRKRRAMRPAGLLLLLLAVLIVHHLLVVGHGHAGHEPAIVYLLSLVAFGCATTGMALLAYGAHLLDRVRISEQWTSHAPQAIRRSEWMAERVDRP